MCLFGSRHQNEARKHIHYHLYFTGNVRDRQLTVPRPQPDFRRGWLRIAIVIESVCRVFETVNPLRKRLPHLSQLDGLHRGCRARHRHAALRSASRVLEALYAKLQTSQPPDTLAGPAVAVWRTLAAPDNRVRISLISCQGLPLGDSSSHHPPPPSPVGHNAIMAHVQTSGNQRVPARGDRQPPLPALRAPVTDLREEMPGPRLGRQRRGLGPGPRPCSPRGERGGDAAFTVVHVPRAPRRSVLPISGAHAPGPAARPRQAGGSCGGGGAGAARRRRGRAGRRRGGGPGRYGRAPASGSERAASSREEREQQHGGAPTPAARLLPPACRGRPGLLLPSTFCRRPGGWGQGQPGAAPRAPSPPPPHSRRVARSCQGAGRSGKGEERLQFQAGALRSHGVRSHAPASAGRSRGSDHSRVHPGATMPAGPGHGRPGAAPALWRALGHRSQFPTQLCSQARPPRLRPTASPAAAALRDAEQGPRGGCRESPRARTRRLLTVRGVPAPTGCSVCSDPRLAPRVASASGRGREACLVRRIARRRRSGNRKRFFPCIKAAVCFLVLVQRSSPCRTWWSWQAEEGDLLLPHSGEDGRGDRGGCGRAGRGGGLGSAAPAAQALEPLCKTNKGRAEPEHLATVACATPPRRDRA